MQVQLVSAQTPSASQIVEAEKLCDQMVRVAQNFYYAKAQGITREAMNKKLHLTLNQSPPPIRLKPKILTVLTAVINNLYASPPTITSLEAFTVDIAGYCYLQYPGMLEHVLDNIE